jgi:hypothetical protein
MKSKKWIQGALKQHHKGALHKQLGISVDEEIPIHILEHIKMLSVGDYISYKGKTNKITKLLKQRANLSLNLRRMEH